MWFALRKALITQIIFSQQKNILNLTYIDGLQVLVLYTPLLASGLFQEKQMHLTNLNVDHFLDFEMVLNLNAIGARLPLD